MRKKPTEILFTVVVNFRIGDEQALALEELAEETDRSKSWLMREALDFYLQWQADQRRGVALRTMGDALSSMDTGVSDTGSGYRADWWNGGHEP